MEFDRNKQYLKLWKVFYKIQKMGNMFFGVERNLKIQLATIWMLRRLALENAGTLFCDDFYNKTSALTKEMLISEIQSVDSVLDIGCGTGRLSRLCAEWASSVTGIDHNPESIQRAKELVSEVRFIEGDVKKILAETEVFSVALLVHVLEHIEGPKVFLSELSKFCKKIIIEVPDYEAEPLNYVRLELGMPIYSDMDHLREYSEQKLVKDICESGWKIKNIRKVGGAILAVATSENV